MSSALRYARVHEFPVLTGQALDWAASGPEGVRLGLVSGSGARTEVAADHIIAATGYRPDLSRLTSLDDGLRSALRTVAGTPVVDRDYQTSAPGSTWLARAWLPPSARSCGSCTARITRPGRGPPVAAGRPARRRDRGCRR